MSDASYREMLKRAQEHLPKKLDRYERFEVPRAHIVVAGRKTVFMNFKEVCDALNREPEQILKFLTKEMATLASVDTGRAVFQGVFRQDSVTNLLNTYIQRYVICPVCKRPDTRVVREKRLSFLVCEACGARSSLSGKA